MQPSSAVDTQVREGTAPASPRPENAPPAPARAKVSTVRAVKGPRPVIAIPAEPTRSSPWQRLGEALYRAVEILVALAALLVSLPILLLEALIIRLDSPGPVLFFHVRAGQAKLTPGRELIGRSDLKAPPGGFAPDQLYWVPTTFRFVKFRTMYVDAAERFPEYYWWKHELKEEEFRSMYYKLADDPRLTRVGKWLRRLTIDELPNFWNVLVGDVRLVGPRPEAPELLAHYSAEELRKFTVKPGITCLSKIYGRGELSVGEQIRWDLEYVRNRSVLLDLKIIFLTAWSVVRGRGAL